MEHRDLFPLFRTSFEDRRDFELMQMDTDNLYFVRGRKTLEDVASIKLREQFEAYKKQWLVCDKCFTLCSGE